MKVCKTCEWFLTYYDDEPEGVCELTNIYKKEDCTCKCYSEDKSKVDVNG